MTDPIQMKNLALSVGGALSVKAAHIIVPSYEAVSVSITISLIFLGIYGLTQRHSPEDTTRIIIGMIALNVTDLLKMEIKLACGFNAFVILILGLMSVKGNQESAEKKTRSIVDNRFSLERLQPSGPVVVRGGRGIVVCRRGM